MAPPDEQAGITIQESLRKKACLQEMSQDKSMRLFLFGKTCAYRG
jgi:hypothetical protein